MSTVSELQRLKQLVSDGALSREDFDLARSNLLETIDVVEEAEAAPIPSHAPASASDPSADFTPLVTKALMGAAGAALIVWLLGAPGVTVGATFAVALAAITWGLYSHLEDEEPEA